MGEHIGEASNPGPRRTPTGPPENRMPTRGTTTQPIGREAPGPEATAPPSLHWDHAPTTLSTKALLDRATAHHDNWLPSLGLPRLRPSTWVQATPEAQLEMDRAWPADDRNGSRSEVNRRHNVARHITTHGRVTSIRTITPQNVWAYTISNNDATASYFESEPTPSLALLGLLDMMTIASRDQEEAEARLLFQNLLGHSPDESGTTQRLALSHIKSTRTSNGYTRDAYSGEAQSTDNCCPGCRRNCQKTRARFTISRHWRSLSATCMSDKTTRQVRLDDASFAYLFGGEDPHSRPNPPTHMPTAAGVDACPYPAAQPPPPKVAPGAKPGRDLDGDIRVEHGLAVAQLNFDRTGKWAAASLLAFADRHHVDIVLLQDVGNVSWSPTGLQAAGWISHRHTAPHKSMILLRITTTQKLARGQTLWRSDNHDSMGITLFTPEGPLFVGTAYIPPNVDTNHAVKKEATRQHTELAQVASRSDHAIVVFDGNETIGREGRVQVHTDGSTSPSGNAGNLAITDSTMACYDGTMIDCHRSIHDQGDGAYPSLHDMTSTSSGGASNTISKGALQNRLCVLLRHSRTTTITMRRRPQPQTLDPVGNSPPELPRSPGHALYVAGPMGRRRAAPWKKCRPQRHDPPPQTQLRKANTRASRHHLPGCEQGPTRTCGTPEGHPQKRHAPKPEARPLLPHPH